MIEIPAVDTLQSEVPYDDLAIATLINDFIAARGAQLKALENQGIPGAAASPILRPIDLQISKCRFAPLRVNEPEKEYSETLEFDTAKIREAIQAGRDAVEREWEVLEPLLS